MLPAHHSNQYIKCMIIYLHKTVCLKVRDWYYSQFCGALLSRFIFLSQSFLIFLSLKPMFRIVFYNQNIKALTLSKISQHINDPFLWTSLYTMLNGPFPQFNVYFAIISPFFIFSLLVNSKLDTLHLLSCSVPKLAMQTGMPSTLKSKLTEASSPQIS